MRATPPLRRYRDANPRAESTGGSRRTGVRTPAPSPEAHVEREDDLSDPGEDGESGHDRARLEALLADNARLREAVAARDSFLAVAAHELRNPMTPILGRVTLLKRAVARGPMSQQNLLADLGRIEELVVHFIKRATTLLDVARADADEMPVESNPVDVAPLVLQIAESYRPAAVHAGASLDVHVPDALMVRGDPMAIEQILENLLTNAIKYGAASPIRLEATAVPDDGVAIIRVLDDGPGIPVDLQSRIFERYERAQAVDTEIVGFGVGLWIVRRLCVSMGGDVGVTSIPGAGAIFQVTLPLVTAKGLA